MRTIKFRPLRRLKDGKIAVASYSAWRTVSTANYDPFELIINSEYRDMPIDEYVHNHKGELLYFYTYNPNDIPVFNHPFSISIEQMHATTIARCLNWGETMSYSGKGIDCGGIPTFSHYTADYLGTHDFNVFEFEPLTVGRVNEWYGWLLLHDWRNAKITF